MRRVNLRLIIILYAFMVNFGAILEGRNEEKAQDSQYRQRHVNPVLVLQIDEPASKHWMMRFRFIHLAILVRRLVCALCSNPVQIDLFLLSMVPEVVVSVRFLVKEPLFQSFLQVLCDLPFNAKAVRHVVFAHLN